MRKYRRHLPLILSALSAIALGTVGFSAWVFVYQSSEMTVEGVNVDIETTKYSTLTFDASLVAGHNKLFLNGGNSGADSLRPGIGSTGEAADLDIKIKLDLYVTPTFVSYYNINDVTFSLQANASNVCKSDIIGKRGSAPTSGWSYVDLKTTVLNLTMPSDITTSNSTWTSVLNNSSKQEYKLTTEVNVSFVWGSYFNNKAPIEFYNGFVASESNEEVLSAHFDKAGQELQNMKNTLNGQSANPLVLDASLGITKK